MRGTAIGTGVVLMVLLASAGWAQPLAPPKERVKFPDPLSPQASLAAIHVPDDLVVELVASEPDVQDPIDLAWGADGRLWVVEMGDYPLGVDGKGGTGGRIRVLDYKTGHLQGLKARVRQPLEDTQLAFYAAQWISRHGAPAALSAAYLALDDRDAIVEVEHREVAASAQVLVDGLAHDWRRMGHGMPLLALGEAATCVHCDARGLCRRDHWDHPRPTEGVQAP